MLSRELFTTLGSIMFLRSTTIALILFGYCSSLPMAMAQEESRRGRGERGESRGGESRGGEFRGGGDFGGGGPPPWMRGGEGGRPPMPGEGGPSFGGGGFGGGGFGGGGFGGGGFGGFGGGGWGGRGGSEAEAEAAGVVAVALIRLQCSVASTATEIRCWTQTNYKVQHDLWWSALPETIQKLMCRNQFHFPF